MSDNDNGFPAIDERQLPRRVNASTAYQEMLHVGAEALPRTTCPKCGRQVLAARLNSGTLAYCNLDGSLHANCRSEGEMAIDPLPPVATFEEQQQKLDELIARAKG